MPPTTWAAVYASTSRPVRPVPARRPSSQSAAETTGLKWAPETGPNIRISTVRPRSGGVEFSSSCRPTSSGESRWAAMPEPTTTVTSRPVPRNSATSRRPGRARAALMVPRCGAARGGRGVMLELCHQLEYPTLDVVADGAYVGDLEAGRVVERPTRGSGVPGKTGQASPQPMETTTSAAWTISSVHGLGYSREMSMPRSAIAAMAAGLTWVPGSVPPDQAMAASPA